MLPPRGHVKNDTRPSTTLTRVHIKSPPCGRLDSRFAGKLAVWITAVVVLGLAPAVEEREVALRSNAAQAFRARDFLVGIPGSNHINGVGGGGGGS